MSKNLWKKPHRDPTSIRKTVDLLNFLRQRSPITKVYIGYGWQMSLDFSHLRSNLHGIFAQLPTHGHVAHFWDMVRKAGAWVGAGNGLGEDSEGFYWAQAFIPIEEYLHGHYEWDGEKWFSPDIINAMLGIEEDI